VVLVAWSKSDEFAGFRSLFIPLVGDQEEADIPVLEPCITVAQAVYWHVNLLRTTFEMQSFKGVQK
jgi:hypothetical protein